MVFPYVPGLSSLRFLVTQAVVGMGSISWNSFNSNQMLDSYGVQVLKGHPYDSLDLLDVLSWLPFNLYLIFSPLLVNLN